MENINVIVAAAHKEQLRDFGVKKEIKSVQDYVNKIDCNLQEKTVHMMFLKGEYDDFTKRMKTAMLFINCTGKSIIELHAIIRLRVINSDIKIAKTTIDFDEPFMGIVNDKEAVLVHLNIPVKGANENFELKVDDLKIDFTDIRVTYHGENEK